VIVPSHRAAPWTARRQHQSGDEAERIGRADHAGGCRAGSTRAQAATVTDPEIFDRAARRLRRDRAQPGFSQYDFLRASMLDGIADRIDQVRRSFEDVLDLGCFDASFALDGARIVRSDAGARFATSAGGMQGDEDVPAFADASFDLVVSAGVLDSVNDLPGALALIRRALRPDGLFLAAFCGAGSLSTLRAVLREAEGDRPAARIHPQIDVRSAGDLLVRAGFAMPVADVEALTVRYSGLGRLLDDLRGMGASNVLRTRHALRRDTLAAASKAFAMRADPDGKTAERFEIVYLTGWAPAPGQPQPAKRGSATASLAAALGPGA
jgi:SAM-dependent methyltransferase